MNTYPFHTVTANDAVFWSRGETQGQDHGQTTIWSETARCVQPMLGFNSALGSPTTDFGWDATATPENLPNGSLAATPLYPPPTLASPLSNSYPGGFNYMDPNLLDPWFMPTPPHTEAAFGAASPSDVPWAEAIPIHTQPMSYMDSTPSGSAAPAAPEAGLAWFQQPDQFIDTTPSYFPMPRSSTEFDMSTLGMPDIGGGPSMSHATCILASLRTRLGKRPRGSDETSYTSSGEENSGTTSRPRKKMKGKMATKRVLVAAGSTSRGCQKPNTETPTKIKSKSRAAERGAGELAAPNVHEVYPRFLLGPSVQGSTVTTVQGAPPQVAGSEEGATWHHVGGTVERQQEAGYEAEDGRPKATEKDHFQIPRRLGKIYKALLEASTEDWARGAVRVLKCRLCPNADFGNWEDYKRHCRFMEAHPYEIVFCDECGDFFARQDALDRHRRSPPLACARVSSDMAKYKRQVTRMVHGMFMKRVECCLQTGSDIGVPFSQIIKRIFPDSSKRGSRQQSRLGASTSQSWIC